MQETARTYKRDVRNITLRTTDGSTIRGRVNLGVKERVSDLFTRSEQPFIILTDASLRDGIGKVLFINKAHIVWAEPED